MKSYWLVLSVLLFYQDFAVLALTLNSPRTRIIEDMMDSEALTDTSSDIDDMFTFDDNLPDVPTGIPTDIETMDPTTCDDWEVFDGSVCVCADYSESRCTGAGGMVCDVHGGKHDSLCDFALEMCHGDVSLDEIIVSCGLCDVLRLVDESEKNSPSVSPGDIDDEEFELEDPTNRTHLVYKSTKSQLMVFFDETVHRWVIGEQHDVDSLIAMVQEEYVDFPQDSQAGFLVATSNGTDVTWEINPTMRLNCVNRRISPKRPDKRFLVTLVVVAVVATTTAYTLRKIQEKKGCLYYPSVCRLRDELKKKLEPEVKKLQSDFKKSYGDIAKFKNEVESSTEVVMDIKDRLVRVKELHVELNAGLRELNGILADAPDFFPDMSNSIASYDQWTKAMKDAALIREISFRLEIFASVATLPALMGASVGFFTMAAAGIGAVAAIAFAVVDIVSSIKEERKVKNDLEKAKSTYQKAKTDLLNAFSSVQSFQREFCKKSVLFLQEVAQKGEKYHKTFKNLRAALKFVYVSSPQNCNSKTIYGRSTTPILKILREKFTKPVADYLLNNEQELQKKIKEVKELEQFLKHINTKVQKDKMEPSKLFNSIKTSKPSMTKSQFGNLFDLLAFIATTSLPSRSCYWGIDLAAIRSKKVTKSNYVQAPVCKSSEISSLTTVIENKVSTSTIPCGIYDLVKGDIFRSRFSVVRYIADNVLPNDACYWGVDLAETRKSASNAEIDKAKLDTSIFSSLRMLASVKVDQNKVNAFRGIVCSKNSICSQKWQDFLMCGSWKNQDLSNLLTCSSSNLGAKCIPPDSPFQKC